LIVDKNFHRQYQLLQNSNATALGLSHLGLSQIAATSLILLGEKPPSEMDNSLFFGYEPQASSK
jgi:hypothetical protein